MVSMASSCDPLPRVVDVDDVAAEPVQQAGGDAGAVARPAVHPQLAGGQRRRAALDVLHRHVDRAGQVPVGPLVALADVDDHGARLAGRCVAEVGPVGPAEARVAGAARARARGRPRPRCRCRPGRGPRRQRSPGSPRAAPARRPRAPASRRRSRTGRSTRCRPAPAGGPRAWSPGRAGRPPSGRPRAPRRPPASAVTGRGGRGRAGARPVERVHVRRSRPGPGRSPRPARRRTSLAVRRTAQGWWSAGRPRWPGRRPSGPSTAAPAQKLPNPWVGSSSVAGSSAA